jgi:hypothetical protein
MAACIDFISGMRPAWQTFACYPWRPGTCYATSADFAIKQSKAAALARLVSLTER